MKHIMAILFDLHHTLTVFTEEIPTIWRSISVDNGIDIDHLDNTTIWDAMKSCEEVISDIQLENDVGPHWGNMAEDWLMVDGILFEHLGVRNIPDDVIIKIEREFQEATVEGPYEEIIDDGLQTIKELHERGYHLGICTRRSTDPNPLLNRHGVRELFGTVQWSGVIGYAKPNPYTLLNAARELGINPRRCAFVGNYVNADIEAALRCEMMPILLTWANPYEGPKAPKGTFVFEKASELLQIFDSPSEVSASC